MISQFGFEFEQWFLTDFLDVSISKYFLQLSENSLQPSWQLVAESNSIIDILIYQTNYNNNHIIIMNDRLLTSFSFIPSIWFCRWFVWSSTTTTTIWSSTTTTTIWSSTSSLIVFAILMLCYLIINGLKRNIIDKGGIQSSKKKIGNLKTWDYAS